MSANVPKFASFRPKPKPATAPSKEHQTTPPQPQPEKSKEHKLSERTRSPPAKKQKVDKDTPPSKSYFADRRGDTDVLRYGALNRYHVPAYRRFGYGYVLGLDQSQKIDRERSSDTKVYITPTRRRRQERLLTDKRIIRESGHTLRFVKPRDIDAHAVSEDFIAVDTRRMTQDDNDEEEETPETSYRSIEGKPRAEQPVDPDTRYDSDTGTITASAEVTKKNSLLVRKTRESPEDIQAWFDFIRHQEAMITLDLPSAELNDATRLQLADVRIPIYEEALKKTGTKLENRFELYQGLFQEAQRSWNEAKLTTKFKEVLEKYPDSTDLWLMYLDFVQARFTQFKYEACRVAFVQCLKTIQANVKGVPPETVLHLIIRLTSMIHGAGYQELALAVWQAVLEIHIAPPKDDQQSFEDFWDSEAPRIGEAGAMGWTNASSKDASASSPGLLQPRTPPDTVFEDFAKRETDATTKLRYPGRSSDDVGEDDAFHAIFFADIQEYLKFIPAGVSTTLLAEAFLCFCGLPPLPQVAAHRQAWWKDPFLVNAQMMSSLSPGKPQGETHHDFIHRYAGLESCPVKSYQMTSELLFDNSFSIESIRIDPAFVRRLLKLVIALESSDDVLAEYLLAFELRHYPSEVVKTAKQILKSRSSSQRLYHAYGLVELYRDNRAKAAQVFSMAISLSNTSTSHSSESLALLSSWAWEALSRGHQVEALWRLVSLSGKAPAQPDSTVLPDQTALDAARMTMSEACEQALLHHNYQSALTCTTLLALLSYLPNGSAESALTAYQHLSNYFLSYKLSSSAFAEIHAQAIARLLLHHVTHAPIVKPALIRSALEPLIALFPDNTILLALYATNESHFTIDDRVRGIMSHNALQSSEARSAAGWSFAIHFEVLRGEIAGSTSHSVRALYKRATHVDASGVHCPALWMAYLRFEVAQLAIQRSKSTGRTPGKDGKKRGWELRLEEAQARTKGTFFTGLRQLPWCKDFVMLAFTEARHVFSEEELWKVYRVMQEKELRIYIELE